MLSDFTLPEKDAQMWAENPFNTGVHPSRKLLIETPPENVREVRNALSANQIARQASEEGGDNSYSQSNDLFRWWQSNDWQWRRADSCEIHLLPSTR